MSREHRRLSLSAVWTLVFVLAVPSQADAQLDLINDILGVVNAIRTRVETAIATADQARLAAVEIRTQVRDGVGYMTPQINQFITNAVNEGVTILEDEWAGLESFAPNGQCAATCQAFRINLIGLLTASTELTSAMLVAADAPANPDLSRVIQLAESAPPRVLYPIYRVLQAVLASDLPARFRALATETAVVLPIVIDAAQEPCVPIIQNAERIQRWSTGGMVLSVVATIIGKLFMALGHTEIEASAGAMGFAGGTIKANGKKKIGEVFTGLASIIDKAATFAANKTRFCLVEAFQRDTRASLAAISVTLSGLSLGNLDSAVSTRASQASVNDVHATLRGVARDVSSLLEGQGGGGGNAAGSLTMRVQIEHHLANKGAVLSVFYLPESFGGVLEVVREVVSDNVAQHQAAGYHVGDAWKLLSRGDAAMAASDFRTSFAWYQSAYQRITNDRPEKREPEKREK